MTECEPENKACKLIQHGQVPLRVVYPKLWYCETHKKVIGLNHDRAKKLIEKKWKENAR